MTQEDKELLLKDLCSRLPYGVKCNYYDIYEGNYCDGTIIGFERKNFMDIDGSCFHIENIRPYLFPLSSMTEEQLYELRELFGFEIEFHEDIIELSTFFRNKLGYLYLTAIFDWFNKNHFDYRGLIPMGLAIDATELNIY